jgi:hypothetical protein
MSNEVNVQTAKNFFQQWAAAISKVCWRCLPKILSGSFRERTGHWPARIAGTREYIDTQALARASQMDASELA